MEKRKTEIATNSSTPVSAGPAIAENPAKIGCCTHQYHHKHKYFGEKTELFFALLAGIFLAAGFTTTFFLAAEASVILYLISYFFGGYFTAIESVQGIRNGKFEIDFLMLAAAIGAAFIGQWGEGALLLFLFSLGHSLEHFAMDKAKKSIQALAGVAPKTALLKQGSSASEVPIEQLVPGDVIIVKPHSKIAADGIIISGSSAVNEAPVTGESIPADKKPYPQKPDVEQHAHLPKEHKVYAGTINGAGNLEVAVTKVAADSTIARLVALVNEAQTQKSSTQNFITKVEKYYVPAVLILVVCLLFAFLVKDEAFNKSLYRAITVLVAASPCALAISTPSAVLSGVARAARGSVLIKGGKPLEALGNIDAIAFDKTGTLTTGKPSLTNIISVDGFDESNLLKVVLAVESLSDHPIAKSVSDALIQKGIESEARATNVLAVPGQGVTATFQSKEVIIGNRALLHSRGVFISNEMEARLSGLEASGNTAMLVAQNNTLIGIITVMDTPRADAKQTIQSLKNMGLKKLIMLSGDNQKVADAIAAETGITHAIGNLFPEQKLEIIEKMQADGSRLAMVGDGVNDAPAMARSAVGIAMGAAGSDVALETADVALMADKLSNLPFVIGLSKKAKSIIRQNLFISLGMVAVLVPLTLLDIAHIGPAVIGHEGSTIVVVFNALRLLVYK